MGAGVSPSANLAKINWLRGTANSAYFPSCCLDLNCLRMSIFYCLRDGGKCVQFNSPPPGRP